MHIKEEQQEKKRITEALKESEKRYRRLFESAKDGILIVDAYTGKVVDVNPFLISIGITLIGPNMDAGPPHRGGH